MSPIGNTEGPGSPLRHQMTEKGEGPGSPASGRLRHPMTEKGEGPGSPASGGLRHPMTEKGEGPGSPASGRLRHPLSSFSPPVREWFQGAFAAPTAAQEQAWPAIATGEHVLISAPTGSGKTLAAFLWALDRLAADPLPEGAARRTRLVYVSPLKALSYDIERNLRAPLRGIGAELSVAI